MKRREFLLSSIAGLLAGSQQVFSADNKMKSFDEAVKLIQAEVDNRVLESAVLQVQKGHNSQLQVFGKAGSGDAIFLLASITKPMTATGLMVLSDRGELRISDKVSKFIPEFSGGDRKAITIQQLLTHISGLPDQLPENEDLRKRHAPLEDFVKGAIKTPLLFDPGTKYKYSSMGFLLLAEIAQRITNVSFAEFLNEEVFKPLGMSRSALDLGPFNLSETVRSQTEFAAPESGAGSEESKDWDWNSPFWRNLGAPWGGAHGSAPDVTRFVRSFLNPDGKVVKESTARKMIQDHNPGLSTRRSLGFVLGPEGFGKQCSNRSFGHGGSTGTLAWADPDTDISCVILTSLPARKSRSLILNPVSDLISSSQ